MKRNRIAMLPGAAGVMFMLVAAVVLLSGWQRSQAEGGNGGPFVWQGYVLTKQVVHDMPNHLDAVADVSGNRLYVTYWYGTILRVNTETGVVEETLTDVYRPEWLALSPDGERLYVSRDEPGGVITVVDTDSFEVVDTLPSPGDVADMVVGPNGRLYVSHRFDTNVAISVLDTVTGSVVGDIVLTPISIYWLALSPDGNVLYALNHSPQGNKNDFVRLDVTGDDPAILLGVPLTASLDSLGIAPDGSYLVMRDVYSNLYQYDSNDLSLLREISVDDEGGDVVISSSGALVSRLWYLGGTNFGPAGIQSFDATTGELVYQYTDTVSEDEVYGVKRLIPLGQDRMALIYNSMIRIVKPADYGVAMPVVPGRYCGSSIFDDFSDPNSGWPSGQSGTMTYGYQDNQYRIYHQYGDQWLGVTAGHTWNDSELLKVEGQVLDGRIGVWGVVFGLNHDWSDFYTLEIVPTHQLWFIWHYSDAAGWQLVGEGHHIYINTSGWNTLEIVNYGTSLALIVNGFTQFFPVISGRVGLTGAAIDGLLDIRYDNYTLINANCPSPDQPLNVVGVASQIRMLERPPLTIPAELP